jgi:hypothetical protein
MDPIAKSPSPVVTPSTTTSKADAADSRPWETGPLKPQFERAKALNIKQIRAEGKESLANGKGYYASMIQMAAANVKAKAVFYGYETGKPMTMNVHQKLPDDRLDLTVFMNVSGHDFKTLPAAEKAKALQDRANDNSYNIKVTRPDGSTEMMSGILARGQLATGQDISITNMKPGKYILEGWPDHSAAVGGYMEGRHVEITYAPGGDTFG